MRREPGFDRCRCPKCFVIENVEVFPDSPRRIIWIGGGHVPFFLCAGVHCVDIRLNQAGIDRKAVTSDKTLTKTTGHNSLKDRAEQTAVPEFAVTVF